FNGRSAPETFRLACEAAPGPLPGVPRDLATVALKCLEKDPARRYLSAGAVADDLARFLAGEPLSARRPGPVARLGRWARRHQGPVYVAIGALVAGVLVVALYPRADVNPPPVPSVPQPPPDDTDDDPRPVRKGEIGRVQSATNRMKSANNL